jgi:hypothetical protein
MSIPSTIHGCALCDCLKYMGEGNTARCEHPDHPKTTAAIARMSSGHCGRDRDSFIPFMGKLPASHSIPKIGGQS